MERKPNRYWKNMSDEELFGYVREIFSAKPSPKELAKRDRGCYEEVRKRKLLEKACIYKYRNWARISDEELIEYHKKQYPNKISPSELERLDAPYYQMLKGRGLIKGVCVYKKPSGFYNNMNKKQWLAHGRKKKFDKLSRSELGKVAGRYYQIGNRKGWIPELIPDLKIKHAGFYSDMTRKRWFAFGKENNCDKLNRDELSRKNRGYYLKGKREGWLDDLIPLRLCFRSMPKEKWLAHGKEKGYNKLSRSELHKIARGYEEKGREEGWIPELIPETKCKPIGFYSDMSKEKWLAYGRERGLDKLSRSELDDEEFQYLHIGRLKGWLDDLIPIQNSTKQVLDQMLNRYIRE